MRSNKNNRVIFLLYQFDLQILKIRKITMKISKTSENRYSKYCKSIYNYNWVKARKEKFKFKNFISADNRYSYCSTLRNARSILQQFFQASVLYFISIFYTYRRLTIQKMKPNLNLMYEKFVQRKHFIYFFLLQDHIVNPHFLCTITLTVITSYVLLFTVNIAFRAEIQKIASHSL